MPSIRLDFVSQDHMVFSGDVYEIVAPGIDGQLGILAKHAPLLTILTAGEVMIKREAEDDLFFAVSGGWMEVRPDKVTILARTAERSDEIDLKRAEAARARAEQLLAERGPEVDRVRAVYALRRSRIRLKVASRRRGWRPGGPGEGDTQTPMGNHK
jgi:F-type H+-transporting ATPase subunit epsilon